MSEFIYLKVPKEKYQDIKTYVCACLTNGCSGVPCNRCKHNLGKYKIHDPLESIREVYEMICDIPEPFDIDVFANDMWKAINKAVEG